MKNEAVSQAVSDLVSQLNELKNERSYIEPTWNDVTDFVLPRRAGFINSKDSNRPDGMSSRRTDSTATESCMMLSDGLMGYTASAAYPWYKLRFAKDSVNKSRMAKDWLDKVTTSLLQAFARSNFYSAFPEVLQDGSSIGTATLYSEEMIDTGVIQFIAVHPYEIYLVEDHYGNVIEIHRLFKMSNRQAKSAFGEEFFSEQTDTITKQHNIVNVVRANTGVAPAIFPLESIYYNFDSQDLLKAEGYYENPYQSWRYRKNTGETYGRSPAIDYLPDILLLNQVTKSLARGVQLATDPPLNAPSSMKGRLNVKPGAANYYTDPRSIISPVAYQTNYSIGENYHQMLMNRVRKAFYADTFLSLEQATRQMTAEEVVQRKGEQAAVLGAIIGRLGAELLDPIIKRVYGIEMRAGRLPPMPEGLSADLKIEYDGPLFQAQKRYYQTNGLTQTLGTILPLGQIFPNVNKILNGDQIVRTLIEAGNMPANTYRDEQEVARINQAEAQAQAQQQAMMQRQQQIDALPALNQAPEQGSPADRLARAAQDAMGGIA
jgi:hypothetical protein